MISLAQFRGQMRITFEELKNFLNRDYFYKEKKKIWKWLIGMDIFPRLFNACDGGEA